MNIILLILIVVVILAVVIWAIESYLPLPLTPKRLIIFCLIILAVLYIIQRAGVF